ncbi:MAG: DUF1178 family protein [Gemmatimonadaceae bacterium]|nr:DUF1178 family protein [Acetobacteraceae bacterium]
MIHYQLRCGAEHGFDGWFRSAAAFDAQAQQGLVSCPVCGDTGVNRALMAPKIAKGGAVVDPAGRPDPAPADKAAIVPDHVRAMLQKLRAEVERKCDYVGPGFADEARRIHRGETGPRSIYGESTTEQAEALADEGIEVARIPWVPRADG